jgi:cell division protease FtsH
MLAMSGWITFGLFVGVLAAVFVKRPRRRFFARADASPRKLIATLIERHFAPTSLEQLTISERQFPFRVRADLQRALDRLFDKEVAIRHFCGVRKEYSHEGITLSDCLASSEHNPAVSVPPQYEEIDVGDEQLVRCLKNGIWFLEEGANKYVVLLAPAGHYGQVTGIQFQIGTVNNPEGTRITQQFFRHLENSVLQAESYRGKILSLEQSDHAYSGAASGIRVHKLRTVARDQVVLPQKTLELLDRNVIGFIRQRAQLAKFRLATKKGLLFYGPPGTGKTHTIHYLARALEGHTTLLITAEQVGLLAEYMTLARLLQPSIVVLEDVDLIAHERTQMSACEEVLLNKLLNEMDGLKEEADILFILTTNRPETLERALSSRPGRVDQAIEFPLPDEAGREKLVRLYSQGLEVSPDVVAEIVRRTDRVSAAFIKELMRRSTQFHLERNGSGRIEHEDVDRALDEMLFAGGSLNLKLLGAEEVEAPTTSVRTTCLRTGNAAASATQLSALINPSDFIPPRADLRPSPKTGTGSV